MSTVAPKQRTKKTEWPHITLNSNGVPSVDGTRHKVYLIVRDYIDNGMSVDEIHAAHPDLTYVQIHAALAYYYDHKAEIDLYISNSERIVEEFRKDHPNKFTREQLVSRLIKNHHSQTEGS
jgi:uncharacterized protein (DUF433 family)